MQELKPGVRLETLTWTEAGAALSSHAVCVVPIGAATKEHGHHLPLNTDRLMADYLAERIEHEFGAVFLPTISYGYYPAFLEYPGSISISKAAWTETLCDIARSLSRHGAAKIYFLNTGISTNWALEPARQTLAREAITIEYTDLSELTLDIEKEIGEQQRGTHADEIETSMMLYLCPDVVQLDKAVPDENERRGPRLSRNPDDTSATYSPTGAWGDPTLATREKGERIIEATVKRIVTFLRTFEQSDYPPEPVREKYMS